MEDRPVEEIPMNTEPAQEVTAKTEEIQPTSTKTKPVPGSKARMRVKSLIALVACCGAVLWAWRSVREGMQPSIGWVRVLRSGNVEDRQIAARQLGEVDPADLKVAVPSLVAALGDKSEEVRAAVTFGLGSAGMTAVKAKADRAEGREAALALTRALADPNEDVRVSAAIAVNRLADASKTEGFPTEPGPTALALVDLLNDPSLKVRKLGRQSLASLASTASIEPSPSLLEGLSRWERAESRAEAARALGSFRTGTEAAVAALTKALKDNDPQVRSNAAFSLQKFGADASPALPALVANLDDPFVPPPPPSPPPGIVGVPSPSGVTAAGEVTAEPALLAANAIGGIGEAMVAKGGTPSPDVIAGLTKALQSPRPAIKEAVEEALKKIGKGASAAIPDLTKILAESTSSAESGLGSTAASSLGSIAPGSAMAVEAINALTLALDAKNSITRLNVVKALGKFGKAAASALPRLQELGDADQELASAAKSSIDLIEGKTPPDAPRRKGGGRRGGPARP